MSLLLVFLGGGLGSVARFGLSAGLSAWSKSTSWPWGTLLCNLAGGLAIGALAAWFWRQPPPSPALPRLLITGFLGGFTTFSAFGLETLQFLQRGQFLTAVGYAAASVIGSVTLAAAGWVLGERLLA